MCALNMAMEGAAPARQSGLCIAGAEMAIRASADSLGTQCPGRGETTGHEPSPCGRYESSLPLVGVCRLPSVQFGV